MPRTHAAVVTSFDEPPHYLPFELPEPHGAHEELIEVLATGLHPRVRSGASGSHYTSTGALPLVPGVDGVGRRADGSLVYFVADDDTPGTMAEHALLDARRSIPLPADADVAAVAAAMNPAMSSWIPLRLRAPLQPGQSVLVLGATGSAGAMAVQIAKLLGAGRVIGVGRDPQRLEALAGRGADTVVRLTDDTAATAARLAEAAADVDVVLDYLWGAPTALAIEAIVRNRPESAAPLDWVEIGSLAGTELRLPSAALRAANLRLLGSGQGSVSPRAYLGELPALVEAIDSGAIAVTTRTAPLAEVERVWLEPEQPGVRTVLVP